MQEIYITKKEFRSLTPYTIHKKALNVEADFFTLNTNPKRLIKLFKDQSKINLRVKRKTVELLDNHKEIIDIPQIIIPDSLVYINDRFSAIASPFINGDDCKVLLSSENIPLHTKILILKQIGTIIDKVSKHYETLDLVYGDVHAGNFIFNGEKTFGIDVDSMKIKGSIPQSSFYLSNNPNLDYFDKYFRYKNGCCETTKDTDILGFIYIIVNCIAQMDLHTMFYKDYLDYLDYLDHLGFDTKLLESFASIYTKDKDNINPLPYIDCINEIPKTASFKEYKKSINR